MATTYTCPACGELVEFSDADIEIFSDGDHLERDCPECGQFCCFTCEYVYTRKFPKSPPSKFNWDSGLKVGENFLIKAYIELTSNRPCGKYPPGSIVIYRNTKFLKDNLLRHFIGRQFKVLASKTLDEEHGSEYLLEGFPWLVYENEISSALGMEKESPSLN